MRRQGQTDRRKKAKIQKIAALCLGGLFVVLLMKTVLAERGGGPAATSRTGRAAAAVVAAATEGEAPAVVPPSTETRRRYAPPDTTATEPPPDPFRPSAHLRADVTGTRVAPARPAGPPAEKPVSFTLTGIVVDHTIGEYVALVDGAVLRAGDVHRGFRIVDVQPSRVVLEKGGTRRVLEIETK